MTGKRRLLFSFLIFICVIIFGVMGFKTFGGQGWSLLDSLYMTVITLSTVGYGEVMALEPPGRIFAMIYILMCLGTIAYAVSSITGFIVEGELKNILGRKRMEKKIARIKDHYIICGSGETANTIIHELMLTKRDFVVVDPSQEKLEKMIAQDNMLFIQGDPAEDEILVEAGIERARGILCSLPTDEANLFVAITARSLNPAIRIIAKGVDLKSHRKMKKAGADAVISPAYIGGMRMVSEMVRPATVSFLDLMLRERDRVYRFEEIQVKKDAPIISKTIKACGFDQESGAILVALKKAGSLDFDFNPRDDAVIEEGLDLIFIVTPDVLNTLEKRINGR
jgi:voltage-gated potassium channel